MSAETTTPATNGARGGPPEGGYSHRQKSWS